MSAQWFLLPEKQCAIQFKPHLFRIRSLCKGTVQLQIFSTRMSLHASFISYGKTGIIINYHHQLFCIALLRAQNISHVLPCNLSRSSVPKAIKRVHGRHEMTWRLPNLLLSLNPCLMYVYLEVSAVVFKRAYSKVTA